MKKLCLCIFSWLAVPILLVCAVLLAVSLYQFCAEELLNGREAKILAAVALVAAVVFYYVRLNPIYVFGHESTHWLVAKLTGHKTGRFVCKRSQGYVEIDNPGLLITLSPYFIPLYFLLLCGLASLWGTLFPQLSPNWLKQAVAVALVVSLTYHFVLTAIALRHGQSDLKRFGVCFSLALVIALNFVFLYLAALVTARNWKLGFAILFENAAQFVQWASHIKIF